MFCRKCGTENADGSPSCISCGEPLTNPFQPGTGSGPAVSAEGKPKNYLVQSILVTFCCCLPLGIVSIVYAAQVDSKWNAGDRVGAIASSENAKKWAWIGFGLGLLVNALAIGGQLLLAVSSVQNVQNGGGF